MNVLLICNYKPKVGGISGQVDILQKMLQADVHTAEVFSTKAPLLRRMLLPFKLKSTGKDFDVFHIHCCSNWGFLPAVVGVSVGRRLGKRIVLTYHGGGGEKFFDRHPKLVRHFLTRTDANIVLSGFLAQVFEKHGLPFATIPNILELDDSRFRLRERVQPNYICTRAHEPLYNIPCILRAFRKVQSIRPEATLTLVGDGSEHENLVQMAKELGLQNVTFTGRVANEDIYTYLDRADIMLSAPTVDNMPVSVLEAMNAGLLVISSKVGGVPYMVKNNNTGLLFDSDDSDALAGKMLWAVDNQTVARAIALQGHKAVSRYRWENIKEQLYETYGIHS
jgi:glycosyltransferase involved in cell wall biosynthesis